MEIETVAEIEVEATSADSIEVDVLPTGPQGKNGLSAYDIYIKNGGILTETEWLASLKGEQGPAGADGYTPVRSLDYWTNEDQTAIKSDLETYINQQLGIIENGEY